MGAPDARVLLLLAATLTANASAAVKLASVKCDAGVVNFEAATVQAACGGSLSAELQGTAGTAGGTYTLYVLKPPTPFVLLSEVTTNVLVSRALSGADVPAEGKVTKIDLMGNLPASTLCGTGYLVVALTEGTTISQQLLSGPITCKDEVVDLMWEFPATGMPSISVTPGQAINTGLVLKLKNSGKTGLKTRLPLDSPEVKILVAGEGTVPGYFSQDANTTMAKMSEELLQSMRYLLFDGAPDTLAMMGRASGAELLLVSSDLTKSRDLAAGSTIDLVLSNLTVSPMKNFGYSYGLPGALIIVADPFNRTNDVNRANNFAVILVNFTSSDQDFSMDDARDSVAKTCRVMPSVEDGGRSAMLVSMHSSPYMFDGKTFGFSLAESQEVHDQLKGSLWSDQLQARLKAMKRCGKDAFIATGDDPIAAVENSPLAQLFFFLSSLRTEAEKLQVDGDLATEQHNTTLLIATALEEILATAVDGDDKSKAFILQIIVHKVKSHLRENSRGMRPDRPMGSGFGSRPGRPGWGMDHSSRGDTGGMPGGMGGFPSGMNGFPNGMSSSGGMNSIFGGMNGPEGGMGNGDWQSEQGQVRGFFGGGGGRNGRNGGGYGGRNRTAGRNETRNNGNSGGRFNGSWNGTRPTFNDSRRNSTTRPTPGVSNRNLPTRPTPSVFPTNSSTRPTPGVFPRNSSTRPTRSVPSRNSPPTRPTFNDSRRNSSTRPTPGVFPSNSSTRPSPGVFPSNSSTRPSPGVFPSNSSTRPSPGFFPSNSSTRPTSSVSPMTASSTRSSVTNGGVDNGLAMAGSSPVAWGEQSDGTFRCKDGELVNIFQIKCDGLKDCRDGSDETNCTKRSKRASGEDDDDNYDDGVDDNDIDDFDDNDVDQDDDDDDDDDDLRDRRQNLRQRGVHRPGRDDDDDDEDDDEDDIREDVIDAFVDLVLEAGDERKNDVTIERFESALEDIAEKNGKLPPAINEILVNSVLQMGNRSRPFSASPMKRSAKSSLFFASGGAPINFWGGPDYRPRKPRCSPFMKEKLEMKKVVSLLFMQLMTKAPQDMKGFTFLPLSLRQALKEALTTILSKGPPMFFKPYTDVLQNNTELQEMVGMMYMKEMMKGGNPQLAEMFDFWRNNVTKYVQDKLKDDPDMLELLDLAVQYLDLLEPYLQEMSDFSDMFEKMMTTNNKAMKMAFLNGRPGAEPSDDERCMRLARMSAEAMQASQMRGSSTSATLFESPFDMVVADQTTSQGSTESPVYWRVENAGVLRGERCPLTGTMMWTKVAVCSCKDPIPQPVPYPGHDYGFGGSDSGGMGPDGMGPDDMGSGGRGPGEFGHHGMGSGDSSGFGLNGQGMGGGGGGRGDGFGMGQGGGGFGMGHGGRRGGRGNGNDDDDDDDNDSHSDEENDDDDDDFSFGGGNSIVFSDQNGGPSINANSIQDMIKNALTNPDGSINTAALQNLLGSQGTGSIDMSSIFGQNPQGPKPAGGNIDIASLLNTLNNAQGNSPAQPPGQMPGNSVTWPGQTLSGPDLSTLQNIFNQGGGGQVLNSINAGFPNNLGSGAFGFGRAALQQGNANSAQAVETQEIKSHLELNRRSEMELGDGTLEVSGEVLVGKERDDGKGYELGSICDDGWGKEEAAVVCNIIAARLSKNSAPLVRSEATATAHRKPDAKSPYKELEAAIKLDGVKCAGNETDILNCQHQGWGDHDCYNNEKASVTCVVR